MDGGKNRGNAMSEWVHRCLVVPDGVVLMARAMAAGLAGDAGNGMWMTPLSKTGTLPATHWISSGLISYDFAALLPCTDIGYKGLPDIAAEMAADVGIDVSAEDVSEMFKICECTSKNPMDELDRLGLKMIEDQSFTSGTK